MQDKKIRWGVISTADIGRWAVNPAIQASGNGELMAVASRDAQTARDFAGQWSIPKYYASYHDLLDDAEIDAAYIPLPNSLHREWTSAVTASMSAARSQIPNRSKFRLLRPGHRQALTT